MQDDLPSSGERLDEPIDTGSAEAVAEWARRLGFSAEEVLDAVRAVGASAKDVEQYLRGGGKRTA